MMKPWPLVQLRDVLRSVERPESVDASREYRLLGVRWYGEGFFVKDMKLGQEIKAQKLYRVCKGDFAYNRLFAWKGSFAVAGSEADGCYVSNEFPCFEPVPTRLDAEFLRWWFRRESSWLDALDLSSGATPTSRNRLKEERFLAMEIPLPPLPEQQRIVARIQELRAPIDEVCALRRAAEREREAIWPSILQAAMLGGVRPLITNGEGHSAAELLTAAAKRNAAFLPSNNNNAHPHRPTLIQKAPADLPDGWAWTTLGSVLTHLVDCVNDTPDFVETDTGLLGLKSTNIRPYKLDLGQRWYVSAEDFARWNRREIPMPGDIILTREAPMGNACMLPSKPRVCLTQRLMLLRVDNETIEPNLLLHFLNTPIFRDQVQEHCRGLTTPHIRVQDAPNFVLPLPPKDQQQDMIGALTGLRAEVDALNNLQNETAAELDALLPSILDRAFRGEL